MLDFSLEKVAFSQRKSAFVDLDAGYKTAFHIGSQRKYRSEAKAHFLSFSLHREKVVRPFQKQPK
jgi:hypothetical protein